MTETYPQSPTPSKTDSKLPEPLLDKEPPRHCQIGKQGANLFCIPCTEDEFRSLPENERFFGTQEDCLRFIAANSPRSMRLAEEHDEIEQMLNDIDDSAEAS